MQISIPEPCHESWAEMTPTQQGRHCRACAKTVVDFTNMSDAQVLAYLKKASGQTCGRIRNDQLERPLVAPIIGGIPRWMSVGLASIATVAGSTVLSAQQLEIQGEIAPIHLDTTRLKPPVDTVELSEAVATGYRVDPMEIDPTTVGQYGKRQPKLEEKSRKLLAFKRFNYDGVVLFTNGQPASFSQVSFLTPTGKIAHTIQTQNDGRFASFFSNEIAAVQVLYQGKLTIQKISPQPDKEIVIFLVEDVAEVVAYRVDSMKIGVTSQGLMVIQRRTPKSFIRQLKRRSYRTLSKIGSTAYKLIDKMKSPSPTKTAENSEGLLIASQLSSGDSQIKIESQQSLTLYPNPSTGYAIVELNELQDASLLNILNASGQLVHSKAINLGATELEINLPSSAARGIYTVQLANSTGETIAARQWIVN